MARNAEREKGETESAWTSYLAYRDLGPERTLEAANQTGTKGVPKTLSSLKKLSTRWRWVERARSWDNHLQRERDRIAVQQAATWEKRRLDDLEILHATGRKLIDRANLMLSFPIESRTVDKTDEKGRPIAITFEPAKWTFRDAAQLAKTGSEMTALAIASALGKTAEEPIEDGAGLSALPPEAVAAIRAAVVRASLGPDALDDDEI
jgi:hypothetical protein